MRKLLFVDDQWCAPEERCTILASLGPLTRGNDAYEFIYETAEVANGYYSTRPVLETIAKNPEIEAVVCDMNFGRQIKFGLSIVRAIKTNHPNLPVIIMSSLRPEEAKTEVLEAGADEYLVKNPTLNEMRQALEKTRR